MIKIKIRKEISKKKYTCLAVISFLVILAVWTLISSLELVDTIFLPTPLSVVKYVINSIKDGVLLANMGISIYRIVMGFILAVILGVPVGILVGTFNSNR